MRLVKIETIDIRDGFDAGERLINDRLVELQRKGCTIVGNVPPLPQLNSASAQIVITYDDPNIVLEPNESNSEVEKVSEEK